MGGYAQTADRNVTDSDHLTANVKTCATTCVEAVFKVINPRDAERSVVMDTVRYINRKQLKKVAAEGDKMGFNRQIAPWVVGKLSKGRFAVTKLIDHAHVGGRPAEPHVRALVQFKLTDKESGSAILDMKAATFESLPTQTVPPLRGRKKYRLAQPQTRFSRVA